MWHHHQRRHAAVTRNDMGTWARKAPCPAPQQSALHTHAMQASTRAAGVTPGAAIAKGPARRDAAIARRKCAMLGGTTEFCGASMPSFRFSAATNKKSSGTLCTAGEGCTHNTRTTPARAHFSNNRTCHSFHARVAATSAPTHTIQWGWCLARNKFNQCSGACVARGHCQSAQHPCPTRSATIRAAGQPSMRRARTGTPQSKSKAAREK